MSHFSLAQAQLYRSLSNGHHVQMLSQTELGPDQYALCIAGEWLGHYEIRCYLVLRHSGHWLTIRLPNDWITDTARLLQPLLPPKDDEE